MVQINSLAAFRRFLALPGATVQITRHVPSRGSSIRAKVKKLQSNGVCFDVGERGSWLYWDRGKSNGLRFDNSDTITVMLNDGDIMQYRCWIEESQQ